MAEVIEDLHFGVLGHDDIPASPRRCSPPPRRGDAVAVSVVERQADEVAALALAALRRLDLVDAAVPVVLGGGVLAARDPGLTEGIRARIALGAPRAHLTFVTERPVLGAAFLVLEAHGSGAAAIDRARVTSPRSRAPELPGRRVPARAFSIRWARRHDVKNS